MPPLTLEQGKVLLRKTIQQNLRHQDYNRVVDIADSYKKYTTGEDIETLLRQFVPRESDELFKQRKLITSITTPDITNTLTTPMYKVGRTISNSTIVWGDKEKTVTNRNILNSAASNFWGDASVEKYLTYRMPSLDSTDPNSFIVVEFDGEVDPAKPETKANPYPFEVNSKEAINYKYINNKLQFLIVLNEDRYTMYLENDSIVAIEIQKENVAELILQFPNAEIWFKDESKKESTSIYFVQVFNHNAGKIPARRVGSILDVQTRNRTCVPLIHPAKCYFDKAIKTVSEFDITNALHTFPKVFRYGNRCPGDMKKGIICNEGKTMTEESNCPICKGTGWSNQTTTASEVIVAAPKDLKDMVSLDMMMAYKSPPIDLVDFQKKYGLYELKELAIKAVYNGETFVSNTVAATATEKSIDLDSVYDTLKPFADSWSSMWVHIYTLIASYRDLGEGLKIEHAFPKDFKMKSLSMLLDDLQKANNSGAASYIKQSINHDIAKKVYADQPSELLKIQTKEMFHPFNGKSENEVNYILSNDLVSRFDKVLHAMFDKFFFDIEKEVGELNFYEMEFSKQKEALTKKVEAYIASIDGDNFDSTAEAFSSGNKPIFGPSSNNSVGIEAEAKAKLKGSVVGVQGILAIQQQVSEGVTPYRAALAILELIYGIAEMEGKRILGDENEIKTSLEIKKAESKIQ